MSAPTRPAQMREQVRADTLLEFFLFAPTALMPQCSRAAHARKRLHRQPPTRSAGQPAKRTTKPTKTPHRTTTTTDNTQQTNNDKTKGTPERPGQEVQGGQGGPGRDHKFPWGTVVSDLAAKAARSETTTTQET